MSPLQPNQHPIVSLIMKNAETNGNDHDNDHEINRKRKNGHADDPDANGTGLEDVVDDDDVLALELRPPMRHRLSPPDEESALADRSHQLLGPVHTPLRLSASHPLNAPPPPQQEAALQRQPRARRNPTQSPRQGKGETVEPPFPWATERRATVYSLAYLTANRMYTISGEVQCKRCERRDEMSLDLRVKFAEIWRFIAENRGRMHDRAPSVWMNPVLPTCRICHHENSLKPVIAEKKKAINWLFLLLGQLLGCCTLEQLKYFCKHTKNHRTGAKDRVLYLAYLGLCKQLEPNGPFQR